MKEKNTNVNSYEVPLTIVVFLLILNLLWNKPIFIRVSLILGVLSLLSKHISGYLTFIWKKIVFALGYLNSHLLLGLVFFIILVPISFLYRLFTSDDLFLKSKKDSYFHTSEKEYQPKDIETMW